MGFEFPTGSAALHLRLIAFGKLCMVFTAMSFEPVTAVTLALAATVVLASV